MKRKLRFLLAVWPLAIACLTNSISTMALDWPQEIKTEQGVIIMYQPQPDKLAGNVLSGRAAMSLELNNREEPIFGAFWFEARIDTDRDTGTALIRDVQVTKVRWPESKDASEQNFTAIVEAHVPESGFDISMERLTASLESAEIERDSLKQIKNDPPVIVFRDELAVLLLYDGEPRYSDIENSDYERVLNTPIVVVRKKSSNDYWLSSGRFWYAANDPMGPWTPTESPPQDLQQAMQSAETDANQPDLPPLIVAADKPTELIVTQGKPDWQALQDGQILYVQNTETPWLRDLPTNNMYVLLSGRWFRSKSQDGPWTFVRAGELPAGFKDIPPASDIGGLRTAVAGTSEAEEAVLDAQIPQTAAIKRSESSLSVEYDGKPKFENIPGTSVSYAVNTGAQVLEINKRYYAVDNGIWYTSASASGPWIVADSIPQEEIDKIPPSSPVYNTTFVHVYDSTPEVVYVGYTPGYLWSFPYYGVPVYGTGWYYPPYYGRWYYPRPPTWGFNVGYNPWTGWNFGMSWSNGFFTFGMSWGGGYGGAYRPWGCCGGWYGGGYRGPTIINTGDINIGNNVNIGDRTTIRNRIEKVKNIDQTRSNLYNRVENRDRLADSKKVHAQLERAKPVTSRENNVFADRDGNVARKVGEEWQTREKGQWERPESMGQNRDRVSNAHRDRQQASRPMSKPSMGFDRSGLDRASNARQSGASRQMARPGNMRHGGGRH